jgi:isopentenyldiphosphate isomerase
MSSTAPAAEESFDILNPDGTPAGFSKPRSRVHAEGLWHRSTHIWILSRERRQVLLQLRSAEKDTYPLCWDVSAAGHVTSGADSASTALRELEEELGLNEGDVRYLFTARAEAVGKTDRHGPFCDREFQDVYLYVPRDGNDVPIEDIKLQEEEVERVAYWDVNELMSRLVDRDPAFVPRSSDYRAQLFPFFKSFLD